MPLQTSNSAPEDGLLTSTIKRPHSHHHLNISSSAGRHLRRCPIHSVALHPPVRSLSGDVSRSLYGTTKGLRSSARSRSAHRTVVPVISSKRRRGSGVRSACAGWQSPKDRQAGWLCLGFASPLEPFVARTHGKGGKSWVRRRFNAPRLSDGDERFRQPDDDARISAEGAREMLERVKHLFNSPSDP
jgi:hypothetical protein